MFTCLEAINHTLFDLILDGAHEYRDILFGSFINCVDKQGVGGKLNVNNTKLMYLVNLSTKREFKNSQNPVNVVYEWPIMKEPECIPVGK